MEGILPTIVDVSEHQGDIDWSTAKNNILFAIIRVQDGTYEDVKLARNVSECQRLGIPYYLYGFYRGAGGDDAKRLLSRADAAGATDMLGYIVDVEVSGFDKQGIRDWFTEVNKRSDKKNGLYVANHLYGEYGVGYGESWVWIPVYGANDGAAHTPPAHPCDLWQFTSTGSVPGISGNCDCNAINGDKSLEWFTNREDEEVTDADIKSIAHAVWNYINESVNGSSDAYKLLTDVHQEVSDMHQDLSRTDNAGHDNPDGHDLYGRVQIIEHNMSLVMHALGIEDAYRSYVPNSGQAAPQYDEEIKQISK